ncbi:MAG: VacJ family lipoprotein [Alphaproteobacteria bacterium]
MMIGANLDLSYHHTGTARPVLAAVVVSTLAVSGCGPATPTAGISDPYEAQNRAVHEFNIALDKNVVRPVATSTNQVLPPPVQQAIVNFSDNLELPGRVANDILQLKLGDAVENTGRFVINTTFGIGGIFDPASVTGAMGKPTDFGETLYVWGVPEGNYVELPVLGPSTDRDAVGRGVDFVLNPLRLVLPCNTLLNLGLPCINRLSTYAWAASNVTERGKYSELYDSILYESADSYAQTRLLYLDQRRFKLGEAPADSSFEDPYAQ